MTITRNAHDDFASDFAGRGRHRRSFVSGRGAGRRTDQARLSPHYALATDSRALRYGGLFSKDTIDVVPSATVRGRMPWSLALTGATLAAGVAVSLNLMRRLRPSAVVGFGGYPTLPPLLAARLFGVPGIIHEANAVLGRANRFLSRRVAAITCFAASARPRPAALGKNHRRRHARSRPAILAAAAVVVSPEPAGPPRLLVVGGSGRARVMADIVPGDRASGTGVVEQIGSHPAGARRRHGAGRRGL